MHTLPPPADFEVFGFPVVSQKTTMLSTLFSLQKTSRPWIIELAGSLNSVPVLRRRVTGITKGRDQPLPIYLAPPLFSPADCPSRE